jgi:hypothetical protein
MFLLKCNFFPLVVQTAEGRVDQVLAGGLLRDKALLKEIVS